METRDSSTPAPREPVDLTIVGGRPSRKGPRLGEVPRGLEVLLKKASVDPEFRKLLLERRAEAARAIEIELTDAEREILANIPAEQLEQIIRNTKVKPEHRAVFLGTAGKLMVAAVVGIGVVSLLVPSLGHTARTAGIAPDDIRRMRTARSAETNDPNDPNTPDPALPPGQQSPGDAPVQNRQSSR
ncbi:MAG: hypothetical protein FJ280_22530 [Planctomycetes bacterium]|nr:hypothetical protein [Planctomycetota bacterium]